MHPDWARSLRDQCAAAGVPFFFKQWGEWTPERQPVDTRSDHAVIDITGHRLTTPIHADSDLTAKQARDKIAAMQFEFIWRVGKKAAGRLLDGIEHNQFPESLT